MATRKLDNEGKELKKLPEESNKGEKIGEISEERRQPGPSQAYNEEVHKPSPENKCNKMPCKSNSSEDMEKTPKDENHQGASRANDDDRNPPPEAKRKGRLEELGSPELIELQKIQKYTNALQQANVESSKTLIARDNDAAHRKQVGNIKLEAKTQLLVPVVVPEILCILDFAKLIPDAKKVQEAADQLKLDIENASRMPEGNQTTTDVEQQVSTNAGSTYGEVDASKVEDKVDEALKSDVGQSTPNGISYHQGDDDLFAPGGAFDDQEDTNTEIPATTEPQASSDVIIGADWFLFDQLSQNKKAILWMVKHCLEKKGEHEEKITSMYQRMTELCKDMDTLDKLADGEKEIKYFRATNLAFETERQCTLCSECATKPWMFKDASETAVNPPILSFSTEQEPSPIEGELRKLEEMIEGMRLQILSTELWLRHSQCENTVHMQWTEYLLGRLAQIAAEAAVTNWQGPSGLSDR
jgi:hypothetical protein